MLVEMDRLALTPGARGIRKNKAGWSYKNEKCDGERGWGWAIEWWGSSWVVELSMFRPCSHKPICELKGPAFLSVPQHL